ncbi:MAG: hypothetical protein LBR73_05950 [Oscillospiraceae bacterium]|jgi:nicotinamidase-related amidase|nr:hypothetical protein [Oscillospiraceae bacterium]
MTLHLQTQELTNNADGLRFWQTKIAEENLPADKVAIVIVDMWQEHWSKGATLRAGSLAPQINSAANALRAAGGFVIHAPSDCMKFYADHPAYLRAKAVESIEPPELIQILDIPQPIDSSDGGSDSQDKHKPNTCVWYRQNEIIEINPERDYISDNGDTVYAILKQNGIARIIYMGVHTNMCILNRPFAIKAMLRRGMKPCLCRDLTDCMYNPAKPPYVQHEEGLQLILSYIEKFYCPTVQSKDLLI